MKNSTPNAPNNANSDEFDASCTKGVRKTNSTPDALTKHAHGQVHHRRGTPWRNNFTFSRHRRRLNRLLGERRGTKVIDGLGQKSACKKSTCARQTCYYCHVQILKCVDISMLVIRRSIFNVSVGNSFNTSL
jgi:hypothetical protein